MKREGGYYIGQIKLRSGRLLNKLFIKHQLIEFNGEQGKILYALWKRQGITMSELSSQTGLAINTLTKMIEKMENQDLVYRKHKNQDKRKKYVYLTKIGESLKEKTEAINKEMDAIFYKNMSEEEIDQFESYCLQILTNLKEAQND